MITNTDAANFPSPPVITVRVDSSLPLPATSSPPAQGPTSHPLPTESNLHTTTAPAHPLYTQNESVSSSLEEKSTTITELTATVPSSNNQGGAKRDFASRIEKAVAIADRYDQRGKVFPRYLHKVSADNDPSRVQEYKDADKLKYWKNAFAAKNFSQCPINLAEYLDQRMPGWREVRPTGKAVSLEEQLSVARGIVERCRQRGGTFPKELREHGNKTREEQYRDAQKLSKWKQGLKGSKHGHACAPEVKAFLDSELPGWQKGVNSKGERASAVQMEKARAIVSRYEARGEVLPRHMNNRTTPEELQEHRDAQKLNDWKQALVKEHRGNCPPDLRLYLDEHMPSWRRYINSRKGVASDHQMGMARAVVARFQAAGGREFPRQWKDRSSAEKKQEYKDAIWLSNWKKLGAQKDTSSSNETAGGVPGRAHSVADVLGYLDNNMPGWRNGSRVLKSKTSVAPVQPATSALPPVEGGVGRGVVPELPGDQGARSTASDTSQNGLKRSREAHIESLQQQTPEASTIENGFPQPETCTSELPVSECEVPSVQQLSGDVPQPPPAKVARI